MTIRKNRSYTKEFQIQALDLAKELGSFSKAASQLGIGDSLLYGWKKKYNYSMNFGAKSAVTAVAETEEVKRLKKENEELKKINYILKRAAAFFSQDQLK